MVSDLQIAFTVSGLIALGLNAFFDLKKKKTILLIDILMSGVVAVFLFFVRDSFPFFHIPLFIFLNIVGLSLLVHFKLIGEGDRNALLWILPGVYFFYNVIFFAIFFIFSALMLFLIYFQFSENQGKKIVGIPAFLYAFAVVTLGFWLGGF